MAGTTVPMPFADFAAYFHSLGWLAALMLAALVPSLPDLAWRRHAGWLVAFCAARLLVEAQELIWTAAFAEWRVFGTVASGMLLWEFARRTWNDRGRPISAATHALAAECIAVFVAILIATGTGPRPGWFAAVELVFIALPVLLGGASLLLLWRVDGPGHTRPVMALRLATVGFGLYGLGASVASIAAVGVAAPWFIVAGLGRVCFAFPAVRSRAALACAAGVVVTCGAGPWIVADTLRARDRAQQTELLARAVAAAAPLQGRTAAQLGLEPPAAPMRQLLHEHLEKLRSTDPLLHTAVIWRLRGDRVTQFDDPDPHGRWVDLRAATAEEKSQWHGLRPLVAARAPHEEPALALVQAPLRPALFESPAAWLALAYPQSYWEVQRQHARRTGAALVGIVAAFCAMGFVLAARQALENAQRLAVERAESADKAKTEFLAFLSHEMRTPLQTILGRTELLQTDATTPDAARRHGAAIETQGRLLLRLVNDLLDLGTLEAGKFQLRPHPFSLRHALAAVEDTIRAPAAAKQLALTIDVAPEVPDAFIGDEARLRQILGNVLGNAVKYTASGRVMLRVTSGDRGQESGRQETTDEWTSDHGTRDQKTKGPKDQGTRDPESAEPIVQRSTLSSLNAPLVERLRFDVTDTGPGLPPDKIPQLFTLFTRLDSGATFTREGTGVGLALVRRLCELMGGTVTAANRAEGGAVFTVRLAFAVAAASRADSEAGEAAGAAHGAGFRVLVAEDNAAAREFLLEALQALGHRAEGAADGPAALAAASARRFDAVLLDVNLPGRDGVSIARTLAARPDRPRLIGCSAEAFGPTRAAALAAGMDTFLEKPVSLAALAAALGGTQAARPGPNLFERLRTPELIAQNRAALAADVPRSLAGLHAAHAAGDAVEVGRRAHYLRSSALLADNPALAELCRQLEREAEGGCGAGTSAMLRALDRHAGAAAAE